MSRRASSNVQRRAQLEREPDYKENPHCQQYVALFNEPIPHRKEPMFLYSGLEMTKPQITWEELNRFRRGQRSTLASWGQRKLALSEVDFLTDFADDGDLVVYAGSAPGTHLLDLAKLFPTLTFHLYDPRDFDVNLYRDQRFTIFQKFFTDLDALRYTGKNVIFLSDIRTVSNELSNEINELRVAQDNYDQARLHQLMKPKKALLKFRLPFPIKGSPIYPNSEKKNKFLFRYLDGEVRLQAFAPPYSTEKRLIPNGKWRDYDASLDESLMATQNAVYRPSIYDDMPEVGGMDDCFDCTYEKYIWQKYTERFDPEGDIAIYVENLNKTLAGGKFTPLTYERREETQE